ncbi:MAG TPA: carbamate kinase [Intrasporangiaceae bacterium]|nr:carbamate kinase [Intrasporangiaceae bacterium]
MKVLLALGGNAMTASDGSAAPAAQLEAIATAMDSVAALVAAGHQVILTHGNGPQVGNILVKNELAAHVVPPVPLDWCGAQTQGTIGFIILDALEAAFAARGISKPVAVLVSRTLVDADDPGFAEPTKPIGRYLAADHARAMMDHGQTWEDRGAKGWRRVVASPRPLEVLETETIRLLVRAGHLVVAAGGGGIPVVRDSDGVLRGVEAVIDKDLTATLLAQDLEVDALVIATDVDHATLDYRTDHARPIGRVTVAQMEEYAAAGQFSSGSMGPKVEAALQFARTGGRSIITSLHRIVDAVDHDYGTIITADPPTETSNESS